MFAAALGRAPLTTELGKLTMDVPAFVKLEHDVALRKAYVTVQDKEIQKQREMWGMIQ